MHNMLRDVFKGTLNGDDNLGATITGTHITQEANKFCMRLNWQS